MANKVRVGIIGAGSYTVNRMLPGFMAAANCEVTSVANRRRANAEKVAAQFGIPNVLDDWRQVIASDAVDAVLIGTAPSLHKEMVFAALDAGKHVLCQTRIAATPEEAREMHAKAEQARARGVRSMLVPPGPFYRGRRFIDHLVHNGYVGRLTHVQAFNMNGSMADPETPLSVGRNELELYGPYNVAQLGLMYDVMQPWTGYATRVLAQRSTFVPQRLLTPDGPIVKAPYPEECTAISETEGGALQMNVLNWAARFAQSRIELYGDQGTIVYQQRGDAILAAHQSDPSTGSGQSEALEPLAIPSEYDSPWLVEEEFVRLVRGEIDEPSFTFWDGVKNMEYLKAVYVSATEGRWADVG
jgi:predicted dehydrogenase